MKIAAYRPVPHPIHLTRIAAAAALIALLHGCGGGDSGSPRPDARAADEDDVRAAALKAPIDYGAGPGRPADTARVRAQAVGPDGAPVPVPNGGAEAGTKGFFGPAFAWPIIPIHMAMTPDNRILTYGTTPDGYQNGLLNYNIWDASLGTGTDAFLNLPNTTGTDIFCAGQSQIPATGEILLVGGDRIQDGQRNFANSDANLFSPTANTLTRTASMQYQRWYATSVTTDTGEQVVLGGRMDKPVTDDENGGLLEGATFASTPEVYNRTTQTWRTLTSVTSEIAYGSSYQSWFYPRAWLAPSGGKIFIVAHNGWTFYLTPAGTGTLLQTAMRTTAGDNRLPSVMYQPGKILSVRNDMQVALIDINGFKPVITSTAPISRHRLYGNATLLADGKVFVNGGSPIGNELGGEHYVSETWDPATGQWTETAAATKSRLYHSNAILMPDGTVVTGGGGAPGPVFNLNAETYYPPYLYKKDGTGKPAPRPVISAAPAALGWNQAFTVTMSNKKPVARVTLLRTGVVTHAFNNEQRFRELTFTQTGAKLKLTSPSSKFETPPGTYLLFAIDANGVPSVAKTIRFTD